MTVHRDKFLIIKPARYTNFSNLFLERNSTCFGQFRNCPKYVVFLSKNKFEKLVHLVGFIIRSKKSVLKGFSINEIHAQSYRTIKFMYTVCLFCEVGTEVSFVI